ncbi:MAG: FKBP-type peptidyl-prolyl cis-trans isomerase, partial [Chromatiales bacterium]|jgi:FKBP-type peptidyl-prolyl cis-trans isomerase FklB
MKKIGLSGFVLAVALQAPFAVAQDLQTEKQKFSYATGVSLGNLLKTQGVDDLDSDALSAGIADVLQGKPMRLSIDEMRNSINMQKQKMQAEAQQAAGNNAEKGRQFLEANKSAKGVQVLDNGLQYLELKAGNGKVPAATDVVSVHYHGTLIDGTVFDSSVERGSPARFALNQVIPGFREAITRMPVGSKWRVFVPSELAYGERGAGGKIGPNQTLIFEIELLGIE